MCNNFDDRLRTASVQPIKLDHYVSSKGRSKRCPRQQTSKESRLQKMHNRRNGETRPAIEKTNSPRTKKKILRLRVGLHPKPSPHTLGQRRNRHQLPFTCGQIGKHFNMSGAHSAQKQQDTHKLLFILRIIPRTQRQSYHTTHITRQPTHHPNALYHTLHAAYANMKDLRSRFTVNRIKTFPVKKRYYVYVGQSETARLRFFDQ